jgi:hypothetical protein
MSKARKSDDSTVRFLVTTDECDCYSGDFHEDLNDAVEEATRIAIDNDEAYFVSKLFRIKKITPAGVTISDV